MGKAGRRPGYGATAGTAPPHTARGDAGDGDCLAGKAAAGFRLPLGPRARPCGRRAARRGGGTAIGAPGRVLSRSQVARRPGRPPLQRAVGVRRWHRPRAGACRPGSARQGNGPAAGAGRHTGGGPVPCRSGHRPGSWQGRAQAPACGANRAGFHAIRPRRRSRSGQPFAVIAVPNECRIVAPQTTPGARSSRRRDGRVARGSPPEPGLGAARGGRRCGRSRRPRPEGKTP